MAPGLWPWGPVLDSLDLRDRGVLGAVAHAAPVAPPRPAPEVVAHYTRRLDRVSRKLERARLQLWAYQRDPRWIDAARADLIEELMWRPIDAERADLT